MKISIFSTDMSKAQSFITKSKKRLKQYTDTVYLNNGDEFEVELFNPTRNKVLAKIEMNGNSIGNGIILRPGERVFLERYLDEAKKFLFETYIVNGNNKDVQSAISGNGDVVVKFYEEELSSTLTVSTLGGHTYYPSSTTWNTTGTGTYTGPTFGTNTANTINTFYNQNLTTTGGIVNTTSSGSVNSINTSYTSNINGDAILGRIKNMGLYTEPKTKKAKSVETGRVEKGSNSDQTFVSENTRFKSYPSETNWWKILPQSEKLITREDLVTYCTECGGKRKKDTHKFCPQCGTKF